ncbi:MAG: hypothetical protein RL483_505 [Pseudomonadota bacterium]|jgi:uncharacterized metal-binding protein YceD (DUF177 family)
MADPDFNPQSPIDRHLWMSRHGGGLQEEGHLLDDDFSRLQAEGIVLPEGLAWQLDFSDNQLLLAAQGRLELPCSRCLQPVTVPIGFARRYQVFDRSDQADGSLDVSDDDLETVSTEDRVSPVHLIEDELLLLAAERPTHGDCAIELPQQPRPDNPFAILAKLK